MEIPPLYSMKTAAPTKRLRNHHRFRVAGTYFGIMPLAEETFPIFEIPFFIYLLPNIYSKPRKAAPDRRLA